MKALASDLGRVAMLSALWTQPFKSGTSAASSAAPHFAPSTGSSGRPAFQTPSQLPHTAIVLCLCSAGDPLCRLTLEAWEGQARATAVLRTFFSSTCGGKDGSGLAGIADADEDAVDVHLRIGGAARTGGGVAARAVVVRLELPGVNRTAFKDHYQDMLTSHIASAAGVPYSAVEVSSALELPATSMTARPTSILGSHTVAAVPKVASSPLPTGSNAATTDAGPGVAGLLPGREQSSGVFDVRAKAIPEGATLASLENSTSGGRSDHAVAAAGRRRLMLGAQGSTNRSPTTMQDWLRVRSLLVTLTIATDKPLITEQRLISALDNETWLSSLQLQLRLPYGVSSFTTEAYMNGNSEMQDSEGGHGKIPSSNLETSTTAMPPGMAAHAGQAAPVSTPPATRVGSSPTSASYLPGNGYPKASGDRADNSQTLTYTSNNDGNGSGADTDAPSSQFIRRTVVPIVVSVLGGALCAAAVVIIFLLRRKQQRRSTYDIGTPYCHKNRKGSHLAFAAEDTLVTSPSHIVSRVDAEVGAITPSTKVPVTSGGCSDGPQPTPTFSVHCRPPAEDRSVGAAGAAGGFTFPSLTPKAAAAAAATVKASTAATATATRGLKEKGKVEKSPIPLGIPLKDAPMSMTTGGCGKSDRILGVIRTTPPAGVQVGEGSVGLAEQGHVPQAPDSPVLGLQPPLSSLPSTALGVFISESPRHELSRDPDGQRATPSLRSIGMPRSDSDMSGTTNVSHVAQMSPSCSVFLGYPLDT
ncbi:hypothetical protein Vretimale_5728 [Volvox reticuliferus]|uniref:Uncharacterized protein n=1 Tax=Volvox reticuliferus TaxID=1737510 RepID=A0A8J4C8M1_9CHLO|nr:hypothetical protein Vretifemale_5820 [Volvox reticuliferus]GIM00808.1 hypothetical protein Vretimale_5728 [Volvox reticuliferus]